MLFDDSGLAFIASKEACALTAYLDTHKLAIGFGQNLPGLQAGDTIEFEQAKAMFVTAAEEFAGYTAKIFKNYPLPQHQFNAVGSVVYNIGPTKMRNADHTKEFFEGLDAYFEEVAKGPPQTAEAKARLFKARDEAGSRFIPIMYNERGQHHNFSRRCAEAILFTSAAPGNYGNISKLVFYDKGKRAKAITQADGTVLPADKPEVIDMPTFLKAA